MRLFRGITLEVAFYYLSVSVVLLLLVLKAGSMSMTHDESSSFFYLNDKNVFFDLFDKNAWPNANNHWLNTILFQITSRIFGNSELAIRLPNVLAFVLYAVFSIKLVKEIPNGAMRVPAFCFIILNAYLLDFFATARGYGLGLSFAVTGIYYFYKFLINSDRISYIIYGSTAFLLSTLSLFSNLMIYAAVLMTLIILLIFNNEKSLPKLIPSGLIAGLFFLFTIVLVFIPLKALSGNDEFKWGTDSVADSFNSLFTNIGYGNWYIPDGSFSTGLVTGLVCTKLLQKVSQVITEKSVRKSFGNFIILTFVIFFIGMVTSRFVFGTLYPLDRKTTLYIPLMGLFLAVLFEKVSNNKLAIFVSYFLSVLLIAHFMLNFKTFSTREWWYDANTKDFVSIIINDGDPNKTKSVGCHWFFYHTINHYSKSDHGYKIMLHSYNKNLDTSGSYDYFVCFDTDFPLLETKYSLLHRDISGRVVLKRK
jgi:hypothetical protein